jgi:malonyl CoA-acyl carrier protein transacylase
MHVMEKSIVVAGTFASLERAVREICEQIDVLARRIPEEEDRVYAQLAKEYLWRMYQSAHQRALASEGLGR